MVASVSMATSPCTSTSPAGSMTLFALARAAATAEHLPRLNDLVAGVRLEQCCGHACRRQETSAAYSTQSEQAV